MSAAGQKPSKATRAIELAAGACTLWHDPDRAPYADIRTAEGVRQTLRVRSRAFRDWLSDLMYRSEGTALGGQAATDAVDVLSAMARDGAERRVYVRLAEHDGAVYLDLGDTTWRAVRVTPEGWEVVSEPPVRFRRPRGLRSLPVPSREGGGWDALRALLHLADGRDWVLLLSWMVGALHPSGPYPILGLAGEHGTGKTTVGRTLRSLLDPSAAPLRSPPREDRELVIAARNGHVLGLDNLSYLPWWLSDALCRIATGGGYSARELYTDGDEVVFSDRRPIILTSIEDVATRGDLSDRMVPVALPRIPEKARRTEAALGEELDRIRPALLGDLLTAVSTGLRRRGTVRLDRLPRMADFAHWVVSCEPALPWEEGAFLAAYAEAREDAVEVGIEADPVAAALLALVQNAGTWEGTSRELLDALDGQRQNGARPPKGWPETPRAMSGRATRAAPLLRAAGWELARDREADRGRRRIIGIRRIWHGDETDRPHRPHRPESSNGAGSLADGTSDGTDGSGPYRPNNRPHEKQGGTTVSDGSDGSDGRMRSRAISPEDLAYERDERFGIQEEPVL